MSRLYTVLIVHRSGTRLPFDLTLPLTAVIGKDRLHQGIDVAAQCHGPEATGELSASNVWMITRRGRRPMRSAS